MNTQGREVIRFVLNGHRHELSPETVEARLAGVLPEVVRKHAVKVNGVWFPAVQAFEVAIGVPRSEFISHTARRHLAALGFEVRGEIDPRVTVTPSVSQVDQKVVAPAGSEATGPGGEEWHTEANVQATVVTALAGWGWRILSVAHTATKERGVDVIAESDGCTLGVEVKGFPSRTTPIPVAATRSSGLHRALRPAIGSLRRFWPRCGYAEGSLAGEASSRCRTFPVTALCTSTIPRIS